MLSIQKPQINILTLAILIISVICFANRPHICMAFFQFQTIHISSASLLFNTIIARVRPQGISKTGQHPSIFYENLHFSLCFSLPIWIWHWLICPRHCWKSVTQPGCKFTKFHKFSQFQPGHKHVPFLYYSVIFSLADS